MRGWTLERIAALHRRWFITLYEFRLKQKLCLYWELLYLHRAGASKSEMGGRTLKHIAVMHLRWFFTIYEN